MKKLRLIISLILAVVLLAGCGAKSVSEEGDIYCVNCGKKIYSANNYCPYCGTPVGGNSADTDIVDGSAMEEEITVQPEPEYEIGDIITFGRYEQDNDFTNGKEDIEWQILEKKNDSILIVSNCAIDYLPYNTTLLAVTWETCTLRGWLNGTFLNSAFNNEELEIIQDTSLLDGSDLESETSSSAKDKVFLLSDTDIEKYYTSDEARKCVPTEYTISQDTLNEAVFKTADGSTVCNWSLKLHTGTPYNAAFVNQDGTTSYIFGGLYWYGCIRPAMWINANGLHTENKTEDKFLNTDAEAVYINTENMSGIIGMVAVGSEIKFGTYEQDNDETNGKEDIVWQVLAKDGDSVLVISKYALDCQPYDTGTERATWEKCTLRKWLNDDFINSAFSISQQARIQEVNVLADKNTTNNVKPGNSTVDRIYLPSIAEAEQYFSTDTVRQCAMTEYARVKGAWTIGSYKTADCKTICQWWLRTPGISTSFASYVNNLGSVDYVGKYLSFEQNCVRPMMWLSFDSAESKTNEDTEQGKTDIVPISDVTVGSMIKFGTYEQDNNTSNGKEEIEWLILDKQDDKMLVISKYALNCREYNTSFTAVTWEESTLRKWLNKTFFNNAFDSDEQKMIKDTRVIAEENPKYSVVDPGNNTTDRIFLLSVTEAEKYFTSSEARKCVPTDYAITQGALTNSDYRTSEGEYTCWWWLRTPGCDYNVAAAVDFGGASDGCGLVVHYEETCVRPAMWISTDA